MQLPDDMARARPQNFLNHWWPAYYGITTPYKAFHKHSSKLIPAQMSEIHTHFMPGLLNVNELFHCDANSLTPECNVHDQKSKMLM
jgi:hypothetical protein